MVLAQVGAREKSSWTLVRARDRASALAGQDEALFGLARHHVEHVERAHQDVDQADLARLERGVGHRIQVRRPTADVDRFAQDLRREQVQMQLAMARKVARQ